MERICLLGLPRSGSQYISHLIVDSQDYMLDLLEPFTKNHVHSVCLKNKNVEVSFDHKKFKSYKQQIDYVLDVLKNGNSDQRLVLKIFLTKNIVPYLKDLLYELHCLNFKFLIVKRENIEHHLLSWIIACETNKWLNWVHTDPITVNPLTATWLYKNILKFDKLIKKFNVDADVIRYESAISDLTKILNVPVEPQTKITKQISGDPYDLISNADEVREFLEKLYVSKL